MKKIKGKKKEIKKEKELIRPSTQEIPDKDDPFDFGGFPKRDLKKNLGCG